MPNNYRGPRREDALVVKGLADLQRALRLAEGNAGKNLRKELHGVAKVVRTSARGYIQHKTGRHGGADVPKLGSSLRIGISRTGVSLYSNAPHAAAQDLGARLGNNAVLTRADSSQYMTRAVRGSQADTARRLDGVLDRVGRDFEK